MKDSFEINSGEHTVDGGKEKINRIEKRCRKLLCSSSLQNITNITVGGALASLILCFNNLHSIGKFVMFCHLTGRQASNEP